PSSPLKNPKPRSITSRLIVPFCATSVASSFAKVIPGRAAFPGRAMTGLTPPTIKHIMGGIATAKTGRRRGHRDAQYDARLSPDAPALPLAVHHPVPEEGDRDPAGGRPPPLHLRRVRTPGCPAGARPSRA